MFVIIINIDLKWLKLLYYTYNLYYYPISINIKKGKLNNTFIYDIFGVSLEKTALLIYL